MTCCAYGSSSSTRPMSTVARPISGSIAARQRSSAVAVGRLGICPRRRSSHSLARLARARGSRWASPRLW
eukprot:7203897-Prymnesium_polylepis.1